MDKRMQEFFFTEMEQGRLDFDADPEYVDLLQQSVALFPGGDLPRPLFDLLETANYISFAHGFRLGLRLERWAGGQSQTAVAK